MLKDFQVTTLSNTPAKVLLENFLKILTSIKIQYVIERSIFVAAMENLQHLKLHMGKCLNAVMKNGVTIEISRNCGLLSQKYQSGKNDGQERLYVI